MPSSSSSSSSSFTCYTGTEDFTTYTEDDTLNYLNVTKCKIDFDYQSDVYDDCAVYKVINISGNFAIDFELEVTSFDAEDMAGVCLIVGIGNSDPRHSLIEITTFDIYFSFYKYNSHYYVGIYLDAVNDLDLGTSLPGLKYYSLTRTGSVFTIWVYNDFDRNDLFGTIICPCSTDDVETITAIGPNGYIETTHIIGYISNLDLIGTSSSSSSSSTSSSSSSRSSSSRSSSSSSVLHTSSPFPCFRIGDLP